MRILREGNSLEPKGPPWYTGVPITCPACECQFELGPYDHVQKTYSERSNTPANVYVNCPNGSCCRCLSLTKGLANLFPRVVANHMYCRGR